MINDKLLKRVYNILSKKQDIVNITTGKVTKTGRVIDGKAEYCEKINVEYCPNNQAIFFDYNTDDRIIHDYYLIGRSSNNETIKAPNAASSNNYFNIFFTGNKICVDSNQDRSRFTGHVYIYYTLISEVDD